MGPYKTPNKSYNNDPPSTQVGKLASIESGNSFPTFLATCPKIWWTARLVEYVSTFYLYSICRIPRISWLNYSDLNLTEPYISESSETLQNSSGKIFVKQILLDTADISWFHWYSDIDMAFPCTNLKPWGRSVELSRGAVMIENVGGRCVAHWWLGL